MTQLGRLFRFGLLVICLLVSISIFKEHQLSRRYLEKRAQLEKSIHETFDESVKNLSVRTLGSTETSQAWLVSIPGGVDVEFTLDSSTEFQLLFVLPRRSKSCRGTFHLEISEGVLYLEGLDNKSKTLTGFVPIKNRPFELKVVAAAPRSSRSSTQREVQPSVIKKRQLLQASSNRKLGLSVYDTQGVFCREGEQIVIASLHQRTSKDSDEIDDSPEVYELKMSPIRQR